VKFFALIANTKRQPWMGLGYTEHEMKRIRNAKASDQLDIPPTYIRTRN